MKPLKVKAVVLKDFNDKATNELIEKDKEEVEKGIAKPREFDYARFEELKSKGFVEEYKEKFNKEYTIKD
jgi:hypothetical protein